MHYQCFPKVPTADGFYLLLDIWLFKHLWQMYTSYIVQADAHDLCAWFVSSIWSPFHSDRENYSWRARQNVQQTFSALPDILSPGRTFSPVDDWQISGHSRCHYRTFYVDWTLLDKMSGKVWALCRTSAEVCRTCPACPAYFAITDSNKYTMSIPWKKGGEDGKYRPGRVESENRK